MKMTWSGLEQEWRKQLLSYAKGNILEVGAGTGSNFKYYPKGVSVTATDVSRRMIEKAKAEAAANGVEAKFIVSSIEELGLEKKSFDTIISTFSLSAYENPIQVLDQFNGWCRPEGNILLLDYGLSRYGVVNWLQKKWEPYHYRRTGNHIDRDILGIISGSKWHSRRVEVKYAGIVYMVWASLSPGIQDS